MIGLLVIELSQKPVIEEKENMFSEKWLSVRYGYIKEELKIMLSHNVTTETITTVHKIWLTMKNFFLIFFCFYYLSNPAYGAKLLPDAMAGVPNSPGNQVETIHANKEN